MSQIFFRLFGMLRGYVAALKDDHPGYLWAYLTVGGAPGRGQARRASSIWEVIRSRHTLLDKSITYKWCHINRMRPVGPPPTAGCALPSPPCAAIESISSTLSRLDLPLALGPITTLRSLGFHVTLKNERKPSISNCNSFTISPSFWRERRLHPSRRPLQMANQRLPYRRIFLLIAQRVLVPVGDKEHVLDTGADRGDLGVLQLHAAFHEGLSHP